MRDDIDTVRTAKHLLDDYEAIRRHRAADTLSLIVQESRSWADNNCVRAARVLEFWLRLGLVPGVGAGA
ncbi:MAG: hypothetical protein ACSLE3_01115 [Microbacteriaceae bacterium]